MILSELSIPEKYLKEWKNILIIEATKVFTWSANDKDRSIITNSEEKTNKTINKNKPQRNDLRQS